MVAAGERERVELIAVDNRYQPKIALKNAELLIQESGRDASCAIVGQNAEPDARAELRQPRTPLVASVGYFPEKYGDGLIRLGLQILARRAVPPAMFFKHQIVTRENVDHLYPNDALMGIETYARF